MTVAAPGQFSFEGGELSPRIYGAVDNPRYKKGLALCKNWIPLLDGPLTRRPGTKYAGTIKSSISPSRLIPFIYSSTQAYILEFGDHYIRFWANYGQVTSGGPALELATSYAQADIWAIQFTQSADTLYLVHPSYAPTKLLRFGATSWQLVKVAFQNGPFLSVQNGIYSETIALDAVGPGSEKLTFQAACAVTGAANNGSGLIRIVVPDTAQFETGAKWLVQGVTGTVEANGTWKITVVDQTHLDLQGSAFVNAFAGAGTLVRAAFAATDVGRSIRLQCSGTWTWAVITSYLADNQVRAWIQSTAASTTASAWALGVWSATTGYPATVGLHQDRLCFSGVPLYPQRVDCSASSNYEDFTPSPPTASAGPIDSNSVGTNMNAEDVNLGLWIQSDEKGMLVGAGAAEWSLRPNTLSGAITPTNVNPIRGTRWGSTPSDLIFKTVRAIKADKATLFVQRGARRLRELHYFFDVDGFRATDLTELAEHITGSGIYALAYQQTPIPVVWGQRSDGALIGLSYYRDQFTLKAGWHQHVLGGRSDASGTAPIIESLAVIPSPDGTQDDLWMVVNRWLNGATVRTVEYMTRIYEDVDSPSNAMFLDCAGVLNSPIAINSVTLNNPVQITTISPHGLVTGDKILLTGVRGATSLNGRHYTVTRVDNSTITLDGIDGTVLPAVPAGSYGNIYKLVSSISGLTWLENETVQVYADGARQADKTVSNSGVLTLDVAAAIVSIGFSYNSDGQLLRLEAGSRNGTAMGKTRRTHRLGVQVHNSLGLQVGRGFSNLDLIQFRTQDSDLNGFAPALQSGIFSTTVDFDYDYDNQVCFRVSDPFPCMIQAFMPMLETQDRA